jgi:hypothetical protein
MIQAGFRIESERALALEAVPEKDWEARRVNVNYAAILRPS